MPRNFSLREYISPRGYSYPRENNCRQFVAVFRFRLAPWMIGAVITAMLFALNTRASAQNSEAASAQVARGTVFVDVNQNRKFDDRDMPFSGVRVSNGLDIVKTDRQGRYEIPLADDQILFVIKPNGFRTALNRDNLPLFFYIHKPDGSPPMRFRGSPPTGELPREIDFPLYRQDEPRDFQVLLFGDPQPRDQTEVNYIARDVVAELIGSPAAFGVTMGDIAFDNLDTFNPLNQAIGLIGIPWYNVIGNHDLNLDAPSRKLVNETFEATYGPTYYSFDYGQVHFVVLDSIGWTPPTETERGRYRGLFGEDQLKWLEKDLRLIPRDQMVVLLMHIPITTIEDCQSLYRLIEQRPYCISVSAHQHYHEHQFLGEQQGWRGSQPHHHLICVTVSGSWWSGAKDERGIPHTTMADGAPNGHAVLSFNGRGYHIDFQGAGTDDSMGIRVPDVVARDQIDATEVCVNVYNGNIKTKVRMNVQGTDEWIELEKRVAIDPFYQRIWEDEQKFNPPIEPKLTRPKPSSHVWFGKLPSDLPEGMHILNVEATDMHGRVFLGRQVFRIDENVK